MIAENSRSAIAGTGARMIRFSVFLTICLRPFLHMKIIFDFGQNSSYSIWTDLNSQMKFVDEEGKVIEFNSMVDAMNFMSDKGWKFQQAYTTNRNSKSIEHWILYKDAESKEKACEGIVTKEEYDKLNR